MNENEEFKPKGLPVILSRLPFFEISRTRNTIPSQIRTYSNQWGNLSIRGQLTQSHRDVLEALFSQADFKQYDDGAIKIKFDPYKVKTFMEKGSAGKTNINHILEKIEEMKKSSFDFEAEKGKIAFEDFRIFQDEKTQSQKILEGNSLNNYEKRTAYRVTLSYHWYDLLKNTSVNSSYIDKHKYIRKMKYSLSKSVTRFLLTHSNKKKLNYNLDTLFEIVKTDQSQDITRKWGKYLTEDEELIGDCGFFIEKDRIKRIEYL